MTTKRTGLAARHSAVQAAMTANQTPAPNKFEGKAQAMAKDVLAEVMPKEKPIALSVRLPPELHDRLRDIAHVERVSIHSLFLEGIDMVLKKRQGSMA